MSRTPTERRSERRRNASQTRPDQTRGFVAVVSWLSLVKESIIVKAVTVPGWQQTDDDSSLRNPKNGTSA